MCAPDHDQQRTKIGRRRFLQTGMAAGLAGTGLSSRSGALLERATRHSGGRATLADIEHIVVLMQENRSCVH